MVGNIIGYLLGMIGATGFKWANHMRGKPAGEPWGSYWRENLPETVMSGIVAGLAFGGWTSGLFSSIAAKFFAVFLGNTTLAEEIQITAYTSVMAGFVLDLVGYLFVLKFWKKTKAETAEP